MLIEERLNKIKKIIQENKSISIESLVSKLDVSKDTIRRDLIRLEEMNVVKRTHGGAVINNRDALIFDYSQRSEIQNPVKERIAIKAAELINDNSSVIFDSSTTVETVIPHLSDKNILAVTNSLTNANRLARNKKCDIKILPGNLHKEQMFLYGSETIQKIEKYHVDYVLLGVFAISDKGLFIHTEEEGLVKRQMVMQGTTVIAVADHTKINTTGFFKVCDLSWINYLVTDELPESSFIQSLQDNNVELILTNT
ncbi:MULTISPECIES: DeoR/GlpR family DNA-binding transcription regulator [Pantoea]|uniref:DeoR/GlpR family DNA-binding transcription regulator n=1 Tax=Pantoea brenneri TaxID=472694 RepID=A0ABU9MPN2_9GAMM|nr:DeoR/GlpR family DNA-binding transcription regulator [Pantoea sp. 3.5.1]KKD30773.1 DeoR faimly transcriptional regulator [Pantoea sp. 3.5.1]